MNTSRTLRFGAFVASVLVAALIPGGFARAATTAKIYTKGVSSGWQDAANASSSDASIDVGGTVTWENQDTASEHPVECVQGDSNAPCPWSGARSLPQRQSQFSTPHTTAVTFSKPGTYAFKCAVHPAMTGKVIVGSGQPLPSSTPSSTPHHSSSPRPTTHASATPTHSASVAPTATKSKGARKPGSTARAHTSAAPSVLAAGPTAAKKGGPSAAATVPAAILIVLVAGAQIARARRRSA